MGLHKWGGGEVVKKWSVKIRPPKMTHNSHKIDFSFYRNFSKKKLLIVAGPVKIAEYHFGVGQKKEPSLASFVFFAGGSPPLFSAPSLSGDLSHGGVRGRGPEATDQLQAITLGSISLLRTFSNDAVADVLFYTSPTYQRRILLGVAEQLNRTYRLFLGYHHGTPADGQGRWLPPHNGAGGQTRSFCVFFNFGKIQFTFLCRVFSPTPEA